MIRQVLPYTIVGNRVSKEGMQFAWKNRRHLVVRMLANYFANEDLSDN